MLPVIGVANSNCESQPEGMPDICVSLQRLCKSQLYFLVGGVGVAIHLHPFFDEAKQPLKVHLYVKKYTFSTP